MLTTGRKKKLSVSEGSEAEVSSGDGAMENPSLEGSKNKEPKQGTGSTIVLPFAKKSPLWKVFESMDVFKAMPQHPHFSPLLASEIKEFCEVEAIGIVVMYTGLLEKLNNLKSYHDVSVINRIDESLLKLEEHGFDVAKPWSRIALLLSIKERQARILKEIEGVKKEFAKCDYKFSNYEELFGVHHTWYRNGRRERFEDAIATLVKAKARAESVFRTEYRVVLEQQIQAGDQEFRSIASAPW